MTAPTNFTFAKVNDQRRIDAAASTVSDAVSYELEWEVVDGDPMGVETNASPSFTLTDGVDWETTYRGRMRAMFTPGPTPTGDWADDAEAMGALTALVFDDTSGSTSTDLTGNGRNATYNGTVPKGARTAFDGGQSRGVLVRSSASSGISVSNFPNVGSNFTFELVFRLPAMQPWVSAVVLTGTPYRLRLAQDGNGVRFQVQSTAGVVAQSTQAYSQAWRDYHVIISMGGSAASTRIVVDGQNVTGSTTSQTANSHTGLTLQAQGSAWENMYAAFAAWDRQLTPSEEQDRYAAANIEYPPNTDCAYGIHQDGMHFGLMFDQGQVAFTAAGSTTTTINVDATIGAEFPSSGYFVVGGYVCNYTGKTSTSFTGVTGDLPSAPGVGVPVWTDPIRVAQIMKQMSELGARSSRNTMRWGHIQPSQGGGLDWLRHDCWLMTCAAYDLEPLTIFQDWPSWTNGGGGQREVPQSEPAFSDWVDHCATFITAWMARYKNTSGTPGTPGFRPRGNIVEIGNEVNFGSGGDVGFWQPTPSGEDYAALFNAMFTAAKAEDPTCTLATAGILWLVGQGQQGPDWINELVAGLDSGVEPDAWSIHPYSGGRDPEQTLNIDSNYTSLVVLKDFLCRHGFPDARIWNTEWGWYTQADVETNTAQTAGYITRSHEIMRDWLPWVDYSSYFVDKDRTAHGYWGLHTAEPSLTPRTQLTGAFSDFIDTVD